MFCKVPWRIAATLAAGICLLSAQLAVAAYACPVPAHAAAPEGVAQAADRAGNGGAPCAGHDADQPGLCLAHCNPADASLSHAPADVPPAMLVASRPLSDPSEPVIPGRIAPRADLPPRSRPPPHAILHYCFRI